MIKYMCLKLAVGKNAVLVWFKREYFMSKIFQIQKHSFKREQLY